MSKVSYPTTRLEDTDGLLEKLTAGVAHDLNNVLTVLQGQLGKASLNGDQNSRMAINGALRGGARLVHHLQNLFAPGRDPMPIELGDWLSGLRDLLTILLGENAIVEIHSDAQEAYVRVDEREMERILLSICWSFEPIVASGGVLSLRLAPLDDKDKPRNREFVTLTIQTKDRHSPDLSAEIPRNGGSESWDWRQLAQRAEKAGASLEVLGSAQPVPVFKISFPRYTGPSLHPSLNNDESSVQAPSHETVLVVEDDPGVRDYIRAILSAHGFVVVDRPDMDSALSWANSWDGTIDLLLTDVALPQGTGLDLSVEIRAKHPDITVLFVSGYSRAQACKRFSLPDEETFLQKPFQPKELLAAVHKTLNQRYQIIVVDDDPAICALIADILEAGGYQSLQHSSGGRALRIFQKEVFDLAIVDLFLPEEDGFEIIRFLRGQQRPTKILAISGASGSLLKTARLLGADAILSKPFSRQELLDAVEEVLAGAGRQSFDVIGGTGGAVVRR